MDAVFVTDGDQRATLAVARALGRAGVAVTVGSSEARSLAGSSRYCTRQACYPSPLQDADKFRNFLRDELRRGGYRVLLPMTDVTMRLVGEAREIFEPLVSLPIPGKEQITQAQDKSRVLDLARQLGIPCPKTLTLSEAQDVREVAWDVCYPAVIKPRVSYFYRNARWISGFVQHVSNAGDLVSKYRQCHAQIPNPLIQEKLWGEGRGVFLLLWNGELKGALCHRRLREKPPWGGVSVYRESIPLDKDLVEKSLALLKAIGWQGVAMVEFKVDARDGLAKLMEVNGRFWGSLQLAVDSGVNFPLMLYRLACGENVPAQFDYKVGVKSRWLLGDLDHLLIRLTHPGPNGHSDRLVSRLGACLDFLKFYEPDLHYEIFRLDDSRPAWFEFKSYVREALRGLTRSQELPDAD